MAHNPDVGGIPAGMLALAEGGVRHAEERRDLFL